MPPPPSNPSQRVFIIGAVIAVCVIAGSSYASYQFGYGRGLATGSLSQTQDVVTTVPEVRAVMGTVERISGQEITLKDFKMIPSADSSTDRDGRMIVSVNQTTLLQRFSQKDAATLKSDQVAFDAQVKAQGTQNTATPLTPPSLFTAEKITLSSVKVGDFIVVYSAEDISKVTTFAATKIDVQDTSAIPLDMRQ